MRRHSHLQGRGREGEGGQCKEEKRWIVEEVEEERREGGREGGRGGGDRREVMYSSRGGRGGEKGGSKSWAFRRQHSIVPIHVRVERGAV